MKIKQMVAAVLVAGSIALTFVGGVNADAPKHDTLELDTVAITFDKIDVHHVHYDNEWKYVPVRR